MKKVSIEVCMICRYGVQCRAVGRCWWRRYAKGGLIRASVAFRDNKGRFLGKYGYVPLDVLNSRLMHVSRLEGYVLSTSA